MNIAKQIFIIVPCYNESSMIRKTVGLLLALDYNVVVVDDGSSEDCRSLLQGMKVYYLRHKINLGQGAALQTGFDFAITHGADYIISFDADGQHEINDICQLVENSKAYNVDVVFGSRFLSGSITNISWTRKFLLTISRYTNLVLSGALLSDTNNGIRLFKKQALSKIRIKENRRTHCSDIINQVISKKISYCECPVTVHYTSYSRKKGIKHVDGIKIFMDMLLFKFFR